MKRCRRLARKYGNSGPAYAPRSPLLLAIDPGKHKIGWALAKDGVLVACGTTHEPGASPMVVACAVGHDVLKAMGLGGLSPDEGWKMLRGVDMVQESPHVRDGFRVATKDIEDLKKFSRAMTKVMGGAREKYRVQEWKGSLPKHVQHKRLVGRLFESELAVMPPPSQHDAYDAAGILLFALGRAGDDWT